MGLVKIESSGTKEISITDPDSRQIKTHQPPDVCYNAHTTVEARNRSIFDYFVNNHADDYASVIPLASGSKQFIENFIPSAERGTTRRKRTVAEEKYHKSIFLYDSKGDFYMCPEGNELHYNFDRYVNIQPAFPSHSYTLQIFEMSFGPG
jgi:hypothetical protein